MSRPRKMTTEQMIAVVDSYYLTKAEGNAKRMKCSLIAAYAIELGYCAEGYDFARNMEVRDHIERMKVFTEVQGEKINVTVYKSLDVAGFLHNNKGNIQLSNALTELDSYWKKVSKCFSIIINLYIILCYNIYNFKLSRKKHFLL